MEYLIKKFTDDIRLANTLQSAQTNGDRNFNRKLTKSYSELYHRHSENELSEDGTESKDKHEPLLRTQSEEPPKSPFLFTSPKKYNGEILINFEPQRQGNKKPLLKTCSDGEIIRRKNMDKEDRESTVSDCEICYQNIFDEDEHSDKSSHTSTKPSSNKQLSNSESIDEEFHENLIYDRLYRQYSASSADSLECRIDEPMETQQFRKSPSVSNDSLDTKDHSDGMWNESVTTVLPVDSDNNGVATCPSCSDLSSPITPNAKLTFSSRRQLLLLQHQQRSSIDTEAIDVDENDAKQQQQTTLDVQSSNEDTTKNVSRFKEEAKQENGFLPNRTRIGLHESYVINTMKNKSGECVDTNSSEKHSSHYEPQHSLSRTDSNRTYQNDMSETSTTDGYITATDSMSGVTNTAQGPSHTTSSFDSVSSHFSLNKTDTFEEFQQVPCSPPMNKAREVIEREKSCDNESTSGRSSSCGSYSVDESMLNKLQISHSTSAASSTEDINLRGAKMNEKIAKANEKLDEKSHGSRKNDEEQLKRDLSADSGYRTIRRSKVCSYACNQNAIKPSIGNGMICHGGESESSDESSDECSCGRSRRASPRCKIDNRSPTTFPRTKKRTVTDEVLRRRSIPSKSPSSSAIDRINSVAINSSQIKNDTNASSKTTETLTETSNGLKAISAESLRSASPGSDSVFYSEHSSTTTLEHSSSVHHHLKDAVSKPCPTILNSDDISSPQIEDIVQPPAGFEDSPRACQRTPPGRLFKKQEKRYRSEERYYPKAYASNARAKSEERVKEVKKDTRPLVRSTDVSMEKLRISHSSAGSDDEDWIGIYADSFLSHSWIYVSDADETLPWHRSEEEINSESKYMQSYLLKQKSLNDITDSENEFHYKYETIINNIVHRKMSSELQKYLASNSFKNVRHVVVCRDSAEYGFRIRGSRPVIVSVVESASPAAYSGLQVGDVILCINNYNVLNASHSDVLKIFQDCTDSLDLEVARTRDILSASKSAHENKCIKRGYMWRQTINKQYTSSWMLRFFRLKEDHCLYSYKNEFECIPLGATNMTKYTVQKLINFTRPNTFLITRKEGKTIYLSTETVEDYDSWISLISTTAKYYDENEYHSEKLLNISVDDISDYEYKGFLSSLVHHNKGNHWKRQFCLLKEARLYFFTDAKANEAIGLIYLHGYKVQSTSSASRRHAFELIPSDYSLKHFLFYTETSVDKRRWMAAMEQSIERWIKVS